MNVIFDYINSVEPAFLFCNDAIYIRIQLLVVLSINCRLSVFCTKDYLVIYLAVTAHIVWILCPWAAPMLLVHRVRPCYFPWVAPMVIGG